ncbi:MAG: HAD-IIIA family hydrolase [Bacteroidota bacterium]|nr:HAD-IIIA family hydrolase [Bacteroidota bacterium]
MSLVSSNFNDSSQAPFRGLEGIILAGGLGTRLRDTVPDWPKCMAPVADRPFLFYVINYLRGQGIEKFIFSLGYKHEIIEEYLLTQFATLNFQCVIEEEPLGTGGAILAACKKATEKNVLVANGDTLFKVNIENLIALHFDREADCTLALKPMTHFDRYGVVELDRTDAVYEFREKQFYESGLINGGIYILDREKFVSEKLPGKFSFEKDYLEKLYKERKFYGLVDDGYFIDIGVPEDYNRAQEELRQPPLDLKATDSTWTLFLDRDGVINIDKDGSYIFTPDEFIFMEGVTDLFSKLNARFRRIIIVTNQRGVGRGLMTEDSLQSIHYKMKDGITRTGGKIDAIYYTIADDRLHPQRKPNPGMAFRAKADFPDIDLSKSIIVGNNISDMKFGKNAGMYTVFLRTTTKNMQLPHPDIDLIFDSLTDFAKAL